MSVINIGSLISKASKESGIPRRYIAEGVEPFMECLRKALESGEDVNLQGIGRFEVKEYPGRVWFVPHGNSHRDDESDNDQSTGRRILLPVRRVLKFIPAPRLKKSINILDK